MSQIRITPQELRDGASFLDQKLGAINNEVEQLKARIDQVTDNWEGAAQSTFVESFYNDMYPIMSKTLPDVIKGIEEQMKGAADTIEQADEQVASSLRG